MVEHSYEADISNAGISRQLAEFSDNPPSPEVLGRHRKHYVPVIPKEQRQTKRDAAAIIKGRVLDALEARPDRAGQWVGEGADKTWLPASDILDKDLQPALNTALGAQKIEDAREKVKSKQGSAELAFAIIGMIAGKSLPVLELEDGLTIEGEFHDDDEDDDAVDGDA
jgi:hypothetical protein